MSRASFERDYLRAASGTVEHAVWEVAHLGMAAFAGVLAQCVRQGGYLLQGSQNGALDVAAAGVALGRIRPSSSELAAPA